MERIDKMNKTDIFLYSQEQNVWNMKYSIKKRQEKAVFLAFTLRYGKMEQSSLVKDLTKEGSRVCKNSVKRVEYEYHFTVRRIRKASLATVQ